jgi:hypothetical protein
MKKSISTKHKLYAKYLKHPTTHNKLEYKQFKNSLNHLIRNSERNHFLSELQKSQNNLRKSWIIIKNIINKIKSAPKPNRFLINGNYIQDPSQIAESFNNSFVNIGQILDKKIPQTQTPPINFIPKNYTINIFLNPATDTEIKQIINNLKDCSCGWDNIPFNILKDNKLVPL